MLFCIIFFLETKNGKKIINMIMKTKTFTQLISYVNKNFVKKSFIFAKVKKK